MALHVALVMALPVRQWHPNFGALRPSSPALLRPVAGAPRVSSPALMRASPIAYDLLQGADVDWQPGSRTRHPLTCVLCHGILGSRRNLLSFGRRLVESFPAWQFLLVDLRCHGQTAATPPAGANTVQSAAADVEQLLGSLGLYPHMLMGHSFGGKVVMKMVTDTPSLPRPVQVWVLDTVPGDAWRRQAGDHPRDTIEFVRTLPPVFETRNSLIDSLVDNGFTKEGACWMATNLKPTDGGHLTWSFDLPGIAELYASYEKTSLWPMLEDQPKGLAVDFVRAARSAFVWTAEDLDRIAAAGAAVHELKDSSHWVHTDNPQGLLDILRPSFERAEKARAARKPAAA